MLLFGLALLYLFDSRLFLERFRFLLETLIGVSQLCYNSPEAAFGFFVGMDLLCIRTPEITEEVLERRSIA